jgi:hypothetical protein
MSHQRVKVFHCDQHNGYSELVCMTCEVARLRREVGAFRSASRELVMLKDGPRDSVYERDKAAAWDRLRDLIEGYAEARDGGQAT